MEQSNLYPVSSCTTAGPRIGVCTEGTGANPSLVTSCTVGVPLSCSASWTAAGGHGVEFGKLFFAIPLVSEFWTWEFSRLSPVSLTHGSSHSPDLRRSSWWSSAMDECCPKCSGQRTTRQNAARFLHSLSGAWHSLQAVGSRNPLHGLHSGPVRTLGYQQPGFQLD